MSENQDVAWLLQEKYAGEKNEAFYTDCERLAAGEPLGYVIGHTPFLDCTIWLDSKPLIPRPETEYWVEQFILSLGRSSEEEPTAAFLKYPQRKSSERGPTEKTPVVVPSLKVLDLCAGSGAIGVAVAKALPHAHITFAELDPAHLPTIEKNLLENITEYSNRLKYYTLVESDLFAKVERQFDFILTNPPYIDTAARTVDPSVEAYEPHLALFGGADGIEVIARILETARSYLTQHGQLWIEHEPFQREAIVNMAATHGFCITTHRDQYDVKRYSVLVVQ